MSNLPQREIHIGGWGLAGANLAWQLNREGIPFRVWDTGENHCTRTAAGLVNPIVFKRLTKTWNIDLLLPFAEQFYSQVSNVLGVNLISHKSIYYIFSGKEDENTWSSRMGDERFTPYIEHTGDFKVDHVHAPFGFGKVNTFGNLDTGKFLDESKKYFLSKGVEFIDQTLSVSETADNPESDFVFCEGVAALDNPLFNYLPLKMSHGEVLVIESEEIKFQDVISRNLFILPLGDNRFKIGATYNWELTKPVITEAGKADLVERFESIVSCKYKIIDHQAGIRPTVADRRPLLGVHPVQKNAFIINGLGTKGVVIAPYYAHHFLEFYLQRCPLEKEVNIERFKRRFAKS